MVDMTPTALKKLDRELNQFLDEMITGMGLCISHQDAFSSSARRRPSAAARAAFVTLAISPRDAALPAAPPQ